MDGFHCIFPGVGGGGGNIAVVSCVQSTLRTKVVQVAIDSTMLNLT